jgi:O-antigen/teichoic acid export membrane protein
MEYEGILLVVEGVLKLGIIFSTIRLGINFPGAILMSFALFVVSIINFTVNLIAFNLNYKSFTLSIDKKIWSYLLKSSFPFALVYILSLFNFRIDIIMLSLMKGDVAAGWYNANYKLLEQFLLVPITSSYVYLPLFSRLSDSVDKLHKIVNKTILPLCLLGIAMIILCYFFGADAIRIVYGKAFADASRYIFVLSMALLPFFIKPILEKLLYAARKQFIVCIIYLAGVVSNIFLNLFMIPRWGINGASFATILTEVLVILGCVITYRIYHVVTVAQRNILDLDKAVVSNKFIY